MRLLTLVLLTISSFSSLAAPAQLMNLSMRQSDPQSLRLVFDLDRSVTHNIFTLTAPYRLVIDLKNTVSTKEWLLSPSSLVKGVRTAVHQEKDLRVVLDLTAPVHTKSFLLKPSDNYGHRWVVEIMTVTNTASAATDDLAKSSPSLPPTPPHQREIVVAIDAGHGGIDSGAVGQGGTLEKDVALAIAKELASWLAQDSQIHPILIRNGDYFLKLRRRVELAREYQADLFISLHADAYPEDNRVYGSSVYMLSPSGASSEAAQWLAEKENAADLIGGISLSDKDNLLASVLLNLSQAGTLEASARVGEEVLKALSQVGKNRYRTVQRASFMVLRSPDISSILVETAFISNPDEEKRLNDPSYRTQVAQAIGKGIVDYFANYTPLRNTLLANR